MISPADKLDLILAETRANGKAIQEQDTLLRMFLASLDAIGARLDTHTEVLRQLLDAAKGDGSSELTILLARFEQLLTQQLEEIQLMRQELGVLPDQVEVAVQDGIIHAAHTPPVAS